MRKTHTVLAIFRSFSLFCALIGLNFRADPVWKSRMYRGILGHMFISFSPRKMYVH